MLLGDRVLSWRVGDILQVGAEAQGEGINESQVSRVNNGREGVAWLLYSPCPSPTFPLAIHDCDTGRRSVETLHVAAVSSRAVGPGTAWGYLTPLGLGGCRPAALMARTQPAGPRLREAQQHMPNTLAGCRTLHLSPVLAGCRAGDLPRSHALVTGTDAGAGPTDVDGEGLCLQQRINIQAGAYALISRPPFFFF